MKHILVTALTCLFLLTSTNATGAELPSRPTEASHPASDSYQYTLFSETLTLSGRKIDFFAPSELMGKQSVPVIVFGHGQAIDASGYRETFIHLAKKGLAVIHPQYDTGFFDQNWRRMAQDFNSLTTATLNKYKDTLSPEMVIFSGHSKGAYVASIAMGLETSGFSVASAVLFNAAGLDAAVLKNVSADLPVTVIWSEDDSTVKEQISLDIYQNLRVNKKQYIRVVGYKNTTPALKADHFFVLSKKYFFGGQNGVTPLHFYGSWKWLMGAALDFFEKTPHSNAYLYGADASSTGVDNLSHQITRSW